MAGQRPALWPASGRTARAATTESVGLPFGKHFSKMRNNPM